jgi:hydrogenase maturation protease
MKRMVVIGIGSLIMKDDGIGSRVVEAVKSNLHRYNITVFISETDFQYCFDEIQPDDIIIIVDAIVQGRKPASIEIMLLKDALSNRGRLRTQHEFSLFDAISLNYPKIQGYLIGIEAAEIGFGLNLSKALSQCFRQICTSVLNEILKINEANNNT